MTGVTYDALIDGVEYLRVFVRELEPGDVTVLGEVVHRVERTSDTRTVITYTNAHTSVYGQADSTMLVESHTEGRR